MLPLDTADVWNLAPLTRDKSTPGAEEPTPAFRVETMPLFQSSFGWPGNNIVSTSLRTRI